MKFAVDTPPIRSLSRPLVHPPRTSVPSVQNILLTLGTVLPVVLYFSWVNRFAVNVPQWDDFAVLASVRRLRESTTAGEWLHHLLDFHNEHRLVYTRLVAWSVSRLSGGPVDFRVLIALGNASLLGLLALFGAGFRETRLPALAWLPVPFLLLHLQYFENTFFAMAALQNLTVWLWAGLALWHLSRATYPCYALALFFAALTTGTSGNGLLVFPVGAVVLLGQKKWGCAAVWLGCFGLLAALYLQRLGGSPQRIDPSSFGRAFLGYLGAAGGMSNGSWLPVLLGACLLGGVGLAGWQIVRREGGAFWFRPEAAWLVLFGFVVLTAVAIALRRPPADVLSVPRYKIGSALALVLAYLLVTSALPRSGWRRRWVVLVTAASVVFWGVVNYRITPHVLRQRVATLQDAADFAQTGRLTNAAYRAQGYAPEDEWQAAVRAGLYRFPDAP